MKDVDVLLALPTNNELLKSDRAIMSAPAYGLNVLATYMRNHGLSVYVLDEFMMTHHSMFINKTWESAIDTFCATYNVKSIGLSVMTNFVLTVKHLISLISDVPVFIGGAHITSMDDGSIELFNCELALKGHINEQMTSAIRSLICGVSPEERIIVSKGDAPMCPPDYSQYSVFMPFKKITTRLSAGCRAPGCSFCCAYKLDPRAFTYTNIEEILSKLPITKETAIEFHDSDFVSIISEDIIRLLQNRIMHNPNIYCHSRVESITEQRLKLLSSVKATWKINIGLESASCELCKHMNKIRDENAINNLLRIFENNQYENITFGFFALVGVPGESREDVEKTIILLKRIEEIVGKIDVSASIVNVIPGSIYYKQLVSDKLVDINPWWEEETPILTAVRGQALLDAIDYWKMIVEAFPQSKKHNTIYASLLAKITANKEM